MSVLTYLYPSDLDGLAVERLLPVARKKIDDVSLVELSLKKAATPDWESLSFVHHSEPSATFLFVMARNTKRNIDDLVQRYGNDSSMAVVRSATKMIWAQHKCSSELPLRRFRTNWALFNELIAVFADIGCAVIDSLENERLFSASTFRRHNRKHS